MLVRPAAVDLPGFLADWPGPAALVEIQLHDANGRQLAQRRLPAPAQQAPADFGRLMQLPDAPAQVMLQVHGQTWQLRAAASLAELLDMQWRALAPALGALLLMGVLALGLAWQARRRVRLQARCCGPCVGRCAASTPAPACPPGWLNWRR